MANIVELRAKSDDELAQMVEHGQEEMFNLRFQHAAMRIADPNRIREVRREIAQINSVLHNRQLAIAAAAEDADVSAALNDKAYNATARYVYEKAVYEVEFLTDGSTIATATVDLNKKQPRSRRARAAGTPSLVTSVDVK